MARNDGIDRTSVRNLAVSDKAVGNTQQHNEREKDCYQNPDIIKVQREQERLDTLTAQADQQKQSLAAIQKKSTLTKNALIHAQDVATLGKKTLLGNYSLTEEEFSQLKSQAAHGFMVDVENRQLKQQLSAAQQNSINWQTRYRNLRNEVQPYLDAMRHAPERVRYFFENLLAQKPERTADAPSKASHQKSAEL